MAKKVKILPDGYCCIYRLCASGSPYQYIGRSVDPHRRERFHWAHPVNGRIRHWKKALSKKGKRFRLEIIALCLIDHAADVETQVIRQTKKFLGENCLNFSDGSQPLSEVWRLANRAAHQTESFRAKMRARTVSDEARELIRKSAKIRLKNPENHPRFGVKLSEETKRKIGDSEKGKIISPEHIAAISRQDVIPEECVRLYLEGNSAGGIAKLFRCSSEIIRHRLIKAGIPRDNPRVSINRGKGKYMAHDAAIRELSPIGISQREALVRLRGKGLIGTQAGISRHCRTQGIVWVNSRKLAAQRQTLPLV